METEFFHIHFYLHSLFFSLFFLLLSARANQAVQTSSKHNEARYDLNSAGLFTCCQCEAISSLRVHINPQVHLSGRKKSNHTLWMNSPPGSSEGSSDLLTICDSLNWKEKRLRVIKNTEYTGAVSLLQSWRRSILWS